MSRTPSERRFLKNGRWYGDFRDYADVGGKRIALLPPGAKGATDDEPLATTLVLLELERLKGLRRQAATIGEGRGCARLGEAVRLFLAEERRMVDEGSAGAVTLSWLRATTGHLERALAFWGADRRLDAIDPEHVLQWAAHLGRTVAGRRLEGERRAKLSNDALRHHLHALSKLYGFANFRRMMPATYNPVRALPRRLKPSVKRPEARFLEVPDAARLLEACQRVTSKRPDLACPFLYELVATFLLTGGRRREVLGLEVDDVSFDRQTITFRPNRWRRLKNATSARVVPLWPQLEAILRSYIFPADRTPRAGLLFPSVTRAGVVGMVHDFRKALATALEAAEIVGPVTPKAFRHTYCSARSQTVDRGQPIAEATVVSEMGHGSESMVRNIYRHLGTVRQRSRAVEYRSKASGDKALVTRRPNRHAKSLLRP